MVKDKIFGIFKKIFQFFDNFSESVLGFFSQMDLKDSNFKKRLISSLILVPFAIYAIYFSKNFFLFLAISIAILMIFEWVDMSKNMTNQTKWRVVGFFYVSIPIYAIIRLRFIDSDIVFWMFLIIWTTDITAYFTGRILGGKKLAPKISPGKTWSGFYGGFLGAILVGLLSSLIFVGSVYFFLVLSIFISIISQLSDLLESKFKRIFGVKDSGNLIPGHGGVLDRLDGMILSAPFLLFIFNLFPHKFGF